ncbi:MAG: multicopper oxidase domain-containing protein [Xanthomonadales bacterium]|nr:multicopper oxidase domain-containing protein [Xanthomonadales bacterium]
MGMTEHNQSDPRFPARVEGHLVFHCHMLGHEDAGMMGTISVE